MRSCVCVCVCVCVCACVSQPGGLLVTVAAVTTAVLQREAESTKSTWDACIYLQGAKEVMIWPVCLFVCLFVSRIYTKPQSTNEFLFNILGQSHRTSFKARWLWESKVLALPFVLFFEGAFTDLSAKQPLQESLFGWRRRLPSPVQVGRNRPVLVKNIQLFETLRLDHLREQHTTLCSFYHTHTHKDTLCRMCVSFVIACLWPRPARGWRRCLWTLCCRKTRLWAPAPLPSPWRTARCPGRLCSRWPAAATHEPLR